MVLIAPLCPADFQYDCLPFHVAQLSERLAKRLDDVPARSGSATESATNPRNIRLRLCSGGERPLDCCAPEKCDEITPPHATPRSTWMPEYQMADPSGKAIGAPQSAEAREVGC